MLPFQVINVALILFVLIYVGVRSSSYDPYN